MYICICCSVRVQAMTPVIYCIISESTERMARPGPARLPTAAAACVISCVCPLRRSCARVVERSLCVDRTSSLCAHGGACVRACNLYNINRSSCNSRSDRASVRVRKTPPQRQKQQRQQQMMTVPKCMGIRLCGVCGWQMTEMIRLLMMRRHRADENAQFQHRLCSYVRAHANIANKANRMLGMCACVCSVRAVANTHALARRTAFDLIQSDYS